MESVDGIHAEPPVRGGAPSGRRVLTVGVALACIAASTYGVVVLGERVRDGTVRPPTTDVTIRFGTVVVGANVVRLDRTPLGAVPQERANGTLLVVLPTHGEPRITFANRPVDLAWLGAQYTVLAVERGWVSSDTGVPLTVPSGAVFLLITPAGTVPGEAFVRGYVVQVSGEALL